MTSRRLSSLLFDWVKCHSGVVTALLFVFCVFAAFIVRTWHYNLSVERMGEIIRDVPASERESAGAFRRLFPLYHANFAPFTIESAVMFSYARDIALGKGVPESDPTLCGMEDIPPYAQMNMALEWFLGWGWRIKNALSPDPAPTAAERRFQDHPRMAQFMSAQLRLWASLTSGLIFLLLVVLRCPKPLALFGGLLHAVSLAAVARSTGQDFVRGEFCIPLIVGALVLAHAIYTKPRLWKFVLLGAVTFLAFVSWDLCQMIFGCWAVFELARFAVGRRVNRIRAGVWGVIALAVLLNAWLVPFNRTYELIRSPLVCAALPALGVCYFLALRTAWFRARNWRRIVLAMVVFAGLYAFWGMVVNTPEYASNYSHFKAAMAAKLEFYNVKPRDPARLCYDARILWTPSMHSATWEIATTFFPSLYFGRSMDFKLFQFVFGYLPVTLAVFTALLLGATLFSAPRRVFRRGLTVSALPLLATVGFTIGFIYIVRYHEFLILFLSVSLPLLIWNDWQAFRYAPAQIEPGEAWTKFYGCRRTLATLRGALITVCVLLLAWETIASFSARRKYTGDVQLQDTARLIAWFRSAGDTVKGKGVAVNLTIGPMLKAYAGTGMVMNPQFGLKRLRDATQLFIEALFAPGETRLLDYCEKYHVKYVVYNNGMLFDFGPYSMRYIAGAKNIEGTSPANLMYYRPELLRWFYRVEPPRALKALSKTYQVFQVILPADKEEAVRLVLRGVEADIRKDSAEARRCALRAAELDPTSDAVRNFFQEQYGDFPELTLTGIVY